MECSAGGRACRSEAATTDGDASPAVGTPWPRGTEGTLAGRVSGCAERGNPVEVRAWPGKPTVREAQFLCGGNGWSRSQCRQAERPQETGAQGCFLQEPPRTTGRIRAHARPERELT